MDNFILDVSEKITFKKKLDYLLPYFGVSSYMTAIYPNFTKPYSIINEDSKSIGSWLIWSINENPNDSGCKNIIYDDGTKIVEIRSYDYKPNEELDKKCPEPDIRLVFSKRKTDNLWVFRGAFKALYPHPILKDKKYVNAYIRVSDKVAITGKHPNVKLQYDLSVTTKKDVGIKKQNVLQNNTIQQNYISNEYSELIKEEFFNPDANKITVPAGIEEILKSDGTVKSKKHFIINLADIPSALISGTTGSGKTYFIQSIITSLIKFYSSDDIKLVIFDSKKFDYDIFNGIKHLNVPITVKPDELSMAVGWLNNEISKRLNNVYLLNENPHLFVIIDDIAQANMDAQFRKDILDVLMYGKRAKVHLYIVTSSPNSRIVPDEIKACISCRIAFTTATSRESRMIIDDNGAEKLKFPGNYIFKNYSEKHFCFSPELSVSDIEDCLNEERQKYICDYDEDIFREIEARVASALEKQERFESEDNLDPLFNKAVEIVVSAGQASTTMLQKKLKLGYARCSRIMDELEENEIVGPSEGAKPRSVLISREEWQERKSLAESSVCTEEKKNVIGDCILEFETTDNLEEEDDMPIEIYFDDISFSKENTVEEFNGAEIVSDNKVCKKNLLSLLIKKLRK